MAKETREIPPGRPPKGWWDTSKEKGMATKGLEFIRVDDGESAHLKGDHQYHIHAEFKISAKEIEEVYQRLADYFSKAGSNVMQGYLDEPGATADVLREGWFHTGYLARQSASGFLTIIGPEPAR